MIRPALERGEVVVCDRYLLTSLALHGGGRGADVGRVRSVNSWGTGGLLPDLSLVVRRTRRPDDHRRLLTGATHDIDAAAIAATLREAADADPDRYVLCPPEVPGTLPAADRSSGSAG